MNLVFTIMINDVEYLSRLKELDLLPLEYNFRLTDLILFHDIVYNTSTIVGIPLDPLGVLGEALSLGFPGF